MLEKPEKCSRELANIALLHGLLRVLRSFQKETFVSEDWRVFNGKQETQPVQQHAALFVGPAATA